jgi:hypothetical protein
VRGVTTGSIGPGTVLAGRYRLDDLLAESGGARFWRATDTILTRSVAIHAVPSDDPRAPGLLDAARVSATVIDPHLLRVLDCDDDDGITWVVNEWGEGISLDLMLQQGTLPPSRAAWLTREVAEAIAAGHAQGVAHGRLNPEAVLVTHSGAVKLIGYVVDASLETSRPPDPLYGDLDARETDVINLAGILYAALTGRWPGVARSSVPPAPREARRPLRPRQVRAGVPRTLDAICERVLHKEASLHAMPIETAHEIAAALADYVGDPALSAPLDARGIHSEPTVTIHRDDLPSADADLQDEDTAESRAESRSAGAGDDAVGFDPEATQVAAPYAVERGDVDPDATQRLATPVDGTDSLAPMQAPTAQGAPPSPFPEVPERPLFASTQRRAPAAPRSDEEAEDTEGQTASQTVDRAAVQPPAVRLSPWATTPAGFTSTADSRAGDQTGREPVAGDDATGGGGQDGYWPFVVPDEDENEVHTGKEGRGWLRTAIVVAVLLVVVVATAIAFNRARQDGGAAPDSPADRSEAPRTSGAPVRLAGATDFDPLADPPEENPESAANAIDGDQATSWTTSTYRGSAALGGLKRGVGLMVDLGSDREARALTVRFKGQPTSFEVYAAPAGVTEPPESLDQLDRIAARADAPQRVTVQLDPRPTTRYLLVWLTRLPEVSGGFRGEITDISVRS